MKMILDENNELIGGVSNMSPNKEVQSTGDLTRKQQKRFVEQNRISKNNATIFKQTQPENKQSLKSLFSNEEKKSTGSKSKKQDNIKETQSEDAKQLTKQYVEELVENKAIDYKDAYEIIKELI